MIDNSNIANISIHEKYLEGKDNLYNIYFWKRKFRGDTKNSIRCYRSSLCNNGLTTRSEETTRWKSVVRERV